MADYAQQIKDRLAKNPKADVSDLQKLRSEKIAREGLNDDGTKKTTAPSSNTTSKRDTDYSREQSQKHIDSTVKGGLASYVANQQSRYATADASLKSALEKDAQRVGYSLSSVYRTPGNGTPIDQRTLREKYAPKNAQEEEELQRAEKELKEKGTTVMPSYARAASDEQWEADLNANREGFYESTVKNGPQASKDFYKMQGDQIAKAGSISKALLEGSMSGTHKFDGLTGQWGTINHQTGQISGNAKMLDPNYDNRLDASLGNTGKVRDQLFANDFADLVRNGQLEDTPENREWFNSYKKEWDAKNPAGSGYREGATPNATIASILASQSKLAPAAGKPAADPAAPATAPEKGAKAMDANQETYLRNLVKQGGGQAEWAKKQLSAAGLTPDGPPSVMDANQKAYLQGLVAKGGGEGEWAKAQLKAAGITDATNQPPAPAAAATPAAAAVAAAEVINTAPTTAPDASTEIDTKMKEVMERSQGDMAADIETMIEFIEDSGLVTLEDIQSFEEANKNAASILDPKYDLARTERREQLTDDQLKRGFFGQAAGAQQIVEETDKIENARAADVATLAQTMVGQSKEDAYRAATFKQGQVQQKLSNMMSILQAKGQLSQNTIANLQTLLSNESNKKSQALAERSQALNEKQFALTEANTYKQWGYDDVEAQRKAQLFPLELESAKLQIQGQKRALSAAGKSTAKVDAITPTQIIGIYKSAAERAGEATERAFPPIVTEKNGVKIEKPNPRAAAYFEQQQTNFTREEFAAYGISWQPAAMQHSQVQGQTGTYAPGQ